MSRKKYLIQEVPPEVSADDLKEGGVVQDPEGREDSGAITPEEVFDSMIRDEMEKEEAKKPPVMTGSHDLAAVMLKRLAGLDVKAEPAPMSFPIRVGSAEAEIDYKVTVSLRAESRRALAEAIDAAIRAGQQDVIAGPVVLYLYAVQGHDRIKTSANGLPYVELIYIFRLRETTPKQEV